MKDKLSKRNDSEDRRVLRLVREALRFDPPLVVFRASRRSYAARKTLEDNKSCLISA